MEIKKKKKFIVDLNSGEKKKKKTYQDRTVRRNHQGIARTRAARQ